MHLVSKHRIRPFDFAFDGSRVRVEQQLGRIEEEALGRAPRAVDAVAVPLAGTNVGDVAVMRERGYLFEPNAPLGVLSIEEAKLDSIGVLGIDRKVGAVAVESCPEGVGIAGPGLRTQRERGSW